MSLLDPNNKTLWAVKYRRVERRFENSWTLRIGKFEIDDVRLIYHGYQLVLPPDTKWTLQAFWGSTALLGQIMYSGSEKVKSLKSVMLKKTVKGFYNTRATVKEYLGFQSLDKCVYEDEEFRRGLDSSG